MRRPVLVLAVTLLLTSACLWGGIALAVPTESLVSTQPSPPTLPPATSLASVTPAMPFDRSRLGTTAKDVIYCQAGETKLKMDVYFPAEAQGTWPVAVYVHGGAWIAGDKAAGAVRPETVALLASGYLVVSVNYRLAPDFRFPAMIEDVKCAVRFLRAHAGEYNLDPDRIAAWGESAGGHLVSLLGVTDANAGFEGQGGYLDQSSRVQAVADLYGPADLTILSDVPRVRESVFGSADPSAPILAAASPVTYVTPDDPPFLILHGDQDQLVPFEHSQRLYDRLLSAGVSATLVTVENAGHGFASVGGPIHPSRDELTRMIVEFLDLYLK